MRHNRSKIILHNNNEQEMLDYILIKLGIKKESLAERANRRMISGREPSERAKKSIGHISGKKYNEMMERAVIEYNKTHKRKLFVD